MLQAGRIEILAPGDGATGCDSGPRWPSAVLNGVSQKPGARQSKTPHAPPHAVSTALHLYNPPGQRSAPMTPSLA